MDVRADKTKTRPQLHESQEHPDQGILAHVQELIPLLEKAGIVVEVDDEEAGEDVDMA